ncbi:MAG: hypothetical protein ACR2RF_25930 [Geminicoccaceae bacterium]
MEQANFATTGIASSMTLLFSPYGDGGVGGISSQSMPDDGPDTVVPDLTMTSLNLANSSTVDSPQGAFSTSNLTLNNGYGFRASEHSPLKLASLAWSRCERPRRSRGHRLRPFWNSAPSAVTRRRFCQNKLFSPKLPKSLSETNQHRSVS